MMMTAYENTASTQSTSSPISLSGGRYCPAPSNMNQGRVEHSHAGSPTLSQSTTTSARPKLAEVFRRFSNKVKRNKDKDKKGKGKGKEKKDKHLKAPPSKKGQPASSSTLTATATTATATARCSANCFTNNALSPQPAMIQNQQMPQPRVQQHKQKETETKETDDSQRRFTFHMATHHETPTAATKSDLDRLFESKGYEIEKKLADTLQGQVYRCRVTKLDANLQYFDSDRVVIKATRKDLHSEGMTILETGHKKRVQENILKETEILKQLTFGDSEHDINDHESPTKYMTRYIDFFENKETYFLVMEDGGDDLFEYVVKCHNLLRKGKIGRKEWRLICKKMFRQIMQLIDYLHDKHQICHLDVSLENMLIQNGTILQNVQTGKISLNRNFVVKFCDFGLSEKFEDGDFRCTKYVGKTRYKSPELWTKSKVFDARLNDIWSLGVALFMMIMGAPPIKYPDNNDENFKMIINGNILELIQTWNRAKYMTPQILDLLQKMLTKEANRITLEEIKAHSWVKLD
eukprot:CAMPEP_0197073706 /NCGR_PEP_ID=MMETSP1384-20130603/210741_1 /TAXON_ID=29189 /ORGANISM="Ammonia sp." /LENGTH=519 /DNA_ID=CAMNT_0042512545 /DNA_START=79 /DNA_END=1638 /DNA_ORIENTATION=-